MLFLAHKWMNKYLNDQNASPPPPKKKKDFTFADTTEP